MLAGKEPIAESSRCPTRRTVMAGDLKIDLTDEAPPRAANYFPGSLVT
jgi:hypothetical protein